MTINTFTLADMIGTDFDALARHSLAKVFGDDLAATAVVDAPGRRVALDGYLFRLDAHGALYVLSALDDTGGKFVGRPADLAGAPRALEAVVS